MPPPSDSAVVLLVRPCDDGQQTYAEFLRQHGLAVIGVPGAWDALTAAHRADVIVTGILLPGGMDGVELIARLRRDERTSHRPIIALTACGWSSERERAARAGCDVFLAKPCSPVTLLRHVRRVLASAVLGRVRGTALKVDLPNASSRRLGIAADSTRSGRSR